MTYDLRDLVVTPMPKPRERLYDVTLPISNSGARFKCLDGTDEVRREQLKHRVEAASLQLMLRVVEINGKPTTIQDLQMLDAADRDYLQACFIEVDGGVETSIFVVCPMCAKQFGREIDPGTPGFFSPSQAKALWKRKYGT